jgi:hypothetical protein
MNTFGKSLEEIQTDAIPAEEFDYLPGVPNFLSTRETAFILSVSPQTIDRMVEKGDLRPNSEGDILKADLIDYMLHHTLADVPVLED